MPDDQPEPCPFSPRQLDVLTLTADGLTRREIGTRLWIGEQTVKSHLANASKTVGGATTLAMVVLCLRRGWIQ